MFLNVVKSPPGVVEVASSRRGLLEAHGTQMLFRLVVDSAIVGFALDFSKECWDFDQDVSFEIHQSFPTANKVVVMFLDVIGQSVVDEPKDIGQYHIFKSGREPFIGC
jgi:hypothetical protein